jgi:hypothetical protein
MSINEVESRNLIAESVGIPKVVVFCVECFPIALEGSHTSIACVGRGRVWECARCGKLHGWYLVSALQGQLLEHVLNLLLGGFSHDERKRG